MIDFENTDMRKPIPIGKRIEPCTEHHELRRTVPHARCIQGGHPEPDWLAPFVSIAHEAVPRLAPAEEIHEVSGENQTIAARGLTGQRRYGGERERRGQHHMGDVLLQIGHNG